jgi:RNA polymerase sigma factor (sigma-70 family)
MDALPRERPLYGEKTRRIAEGTSKMRGRSSRDVLRHLRTLYAFGVIGDLTDEQLLQCFVRRDEAADEAFAILVERHGAMVLGVCLRVLGNNSHEAEDAFQATFLVLAKKARSVSRRDKLASWLYGTALRTANQSRRRAARRRTHEKRVSLPISDQHPDPAISSEFRTILDEELARLPAAHRVVVILCELEGLSRSEAARRLDIPEGTLSSRLARAKIQLRDRLTRRGLALSTFTLSSALIRQSHAVSVPLSLIETTVAGAAHLATTSSLAAGLMTVSVATLTEGVLQTMFVTKLKASVLGIGTLTAVVSGAMVLGQPEDPAKSSVVPPPSAPIGKTLNKSDRTAPPTASNPNLNRNHNLNPGINPNLSLNLNPNPDPASPIPKLGPGDQPQAPNPDLNPLVTSPTPDPIPERPLEKLELSEEAKSAEDRTAALEKKLDRILKALDRMALPTPNLARVVNQVESAPTGRFSVPKAKPGPAGSIAPPPIRVNSPFDGEIEKPAASRPDAPRPATAPIPEPAPDPFLNNPKSPAPMTNRLDMLEKNLDRASRRMTRLEDRMSALEKIVGVPTIQSTEDTTSPEPPSMINDLDPLADAAVPGPDNMSPPRPN